jgi:hypothetical protein
MAFRGISEECLGQMLGAKLSIRVSAKGREREREREIVGGKVGLPEAEHEG